MSKVWFVTGANSGIGAGIVNAALAAGNRVVATSRSIKKLRAAFPDADDQSLALVELDVTDEGQAYAAVAKAVELFGTVDVLVSNAGFCVLGNFEDLTAADFERQMATNFYGARYAGHLGWHSRHEGDRVGRQRGRRDWRGRCGAGYRQRRFPRNRSAHPKLTNHAGKTGVVRAIILGIPASTHKQTSPPPFQLPSFGRSFISGLRPLWEPDPANSNVVTGQ